MRTNQQKLTSASSCDLEYDFAGVPARQSVRGNAFWQSASGSEFEAAGATSEEDLPRMASRRAPLAAVADS